VFALDQKVGQRTHLMPTSGGHDKQGRLQYKHGGWLHEGKIVRSLKRLFHRLLVLGLGILIVWLIVFVFRFTDHRLPTVLALIITYGIAAYINPPARCPDGPQNSAAQTGASLHNYRRRIAG
jgi:hypothetical protein